MPCSFSQVVMPHCLHGAMNSCSDSHCGQVVDSGLGQMWKETVMVYCGILSWFYSVATGENWKNLCRCCRSATKIGLMGKWWIGSNEKGDANGILRNIILVLFCSYWGKLNLSLSVLSICNQDLDPALVRYKEEILSNCIRIWMLRWVMKDFKMCLFCL